MDADAEPHGFALGHARIFLGQSLLHRDRALHGIDGTDEIGDDAVAGGVEDPPAMRRDQPVHDFAAGLEPGERAGLVQPHQPAVAGDVGGEDRGEFSFDRWDGHLAAPLDAEYSRSNRRIGMSPIGLREATPAATNAVCRRWLIARVVTPGAAGISL